MIKPCLIVSLLVVLPAMVHCVNITRIGGANVCSDPVMMTTHPITGVVFLACTQSSPTEYSLLSIDPTTRLFTGIVLGKSCKQPIALVISRDSNTLYMTCTHDNNHDRTLLIIDLDPSHNYAIRTINLNDYVCGYDDRDQGRHELTVTLTKGGSIVYIMCKNLVQLFDYGPAQNVSINEYTLNIPDNCGRYQLQSQYDTGILYLTCVNLRDNYNVTLIQIQMPPEGLPILTTLTPPINMDILQVQVHQTSGFLIIASLSYGIVCSPPLSLENPTILVSQYTGVDQIFLDYSSVSSSCKATNVCFLSSHHHIDNSISYYDGWYEKEIVLAPPDQPCQQWSTIAYNEQTQTIVAVCIDAEKITQKGIYTITY